MSTSSYRAINDSVIVEIPEANVEVKHESGLVLLENIQSNKTTAIGTVISVGEGKFDPKTGTFVPPTIKVGDQIVLGFSTGVVLDKTHKMVRIDDIFAVVE